MARSPSAEDYLLDLFWYFVTTRATVADYCEMLLAGHRAPDFPTDTQTLEKDLGIAPPRAYAYLGVPFKEFGKIVVAFSPVPDDTEIAPFDTGGLVNKIAPVCGWAQAQRRQYLAAYTFAGPEIETRFEEWPTGPRTVDYLKETLPNPPVGPHDVWGGPAADIWDANLNGDPRVRLWEARSEAPLAGERMICWATEPALGDRIVSYLSDEDSGIDEDKAQRVVGLRYHGSPDDLVEAARMQQVTA